MNPYKVEGPATVSFSGGRTSGFMVGKMLEAYEGEWPDDVHILFENTGLEHPKTYDFIKQMEEKWPVPITWLKLVFDAEGNKDFKIVDYETASRKGEPFKALIESRDYPPNPLTRFCTTELKIRTARRYVKDVLGFDDWDNCIGLRADEPRRVAKMKGDIASEHPVLPIAQAGHTLQDVLTFWEEQDFDLELPGNDNAFGNCVGCFLKGRSKIQKIMEHDPEHFEWWAKIEEELGKPFRIDRPSYRSMLTEITIQGKLFDDRYPDDSMPCMCHD